MFYVGITRNFKNRISQHQNFFINIEKIELLHECLSPEQANIWERIEIANYKSYAFQINLKGYNKTLGGSGWFDKKAMAAKQENKRRIKSLKIL